MLDDLWQQFDKRYIVIGPVEPNNKHYSWHYYKILNYEMFEILIKNTDYKNNIDPKQILYNCKAAYIASHNAYSALCYPDGANIRKCWCGNRGWKSRCSCDAFYKPYDFNYLKDHHSLYPAYPKLERSTLTVMPENKAAFDYVYDCKYEPGIMPYFGSIFTLLRSYETKTKQEQQTDLVKVGFAEQYEQSVRSILIGQVFCPCE